MINFKDFLYSEEIDLIIEGIDDDEVEPLDGHWQNAGLESSANAGHAQYKFNVPGDNCGRANPCYWVNMSGTPTSAISISFSRLGSYSDQNRGVGTDVMRGVLKCIGEYVKKIKPAKMYWSPIGKTTPNARSSNDARWTKINSDARARIYQGWATRHLFPDKYVGMKNNWVRRDVYDREFIPNGYPAIPDEVTSSSPSGDKAKALKSMEKQVSDNQAQISQHQEEMRREERRRQDEEERQTIERREAERAERARIAQERLDAAMSDPHKNPHGLKVDDIVNVEGDYGVSEASRHQPAKIAVFKVYSADPADHYGLQANIIFATESGDFDGQSIWVDIDRLQKESPEITAQREQRRQESLAEFINNPEYNPYGVKEGDDIFSYMPESPDSDQNGLLGKIRKLKKHTTRLGNTFTFNRHPQRVLHTLFNDDISLIAYVDWDENATRVFGYNKNNRPVDVKHLRKATPEERERIAREKRNKEIEQQIQAGRARQERRSGAVPGGVYPSHGYDTPQTPEEIEQLVNHPSNPMHLRPGDMVKSSGWQYRGRGGVIVRIEKTYYGDKIIGYVRFHGSTARNPTSFRFLDELQRDDSPQAQALLNRRQQQQERHRRIASHSNGLNIGDTITVASGVHRGKTGRIVSFRTSGQNVIAVVAAHEGSFNVNVRMIQPNAQPVAAESLGFFRYYLNRYAE